MRLLFHSIVKMVGSGKLAKDFDIPAMTLTSLEK